MGLGLPKPIFLKIYMGIELILAPWSQNLWAMMDCLIVIWIVKLPGSFNLVGKLFYIPEVHSSVSATIKYSIILLLFATMSLMYFTYFGISYKTSTKERLMCTCYSMNFLKHASSFCLFNFYGNEGGGFTLANILSTFAFF